MEQERTLKLTLEHYGKKITIEIDEDSAFDEVVDNLIVPAFLTIGFHRNTIKKYIKSDML